MLNENIALPDKKKLLNLQISHVLKFIVAPEVMVMLTLKAIKLLSCLVPHFLGLLVFSGGLKLKVNMLCLECSLQKLGFNLQMSILQVFLISVLGLEQFQLLFVA